MITFAADWIPRISPRIHITARFVQTQLLILPIIFLIVAFILCNISLNMTILADGIVIAVNHAALT